jgi:hypothetical protein
VPHHEGLLSHGSTHAAAAVCHSAEHLLQEKPHPGSYTYIPLTFDTTHLALCGSAASHDPACQVPLVTCTQARPDLLRAAATTAAAAAAADVLLWEAPHVCLAPLAPAAAAALEVAAEVTSHLGLLRCHVPARVFVDTGSTTRGCQGVSSKQ